MTVVTCSHCRCQLSDTNVWCPGCGHPVPPSNSPTVVNLEDDQPGSETVNLSGDPPWPAWPEEYEGEDKP